MSMTKRLSRVLRLCVASSCLSVALAMPVLAQGSGPIRLAVGAPAGGSIDVYSRIIAEHMSGTLGRPVIIEIKAGANGNIAAQWVLDSPADGSQIWVGAQSMLEINPSTYKNLRWKRSDFIPVIKGIETPLVLVTHPSVPAATFEEWVAFARANRGKLSYANYGPGTISHFLGYQLNERFGLELTQVPYRGNAPQMVDLLAGHALFGFTQLQSAVEPARSGLLRALVASGPKRSALLPEVPTLADLGHGDLTASAWFGLLVKTGTPLDVVKRLEAAAIAAHADPGVRAKLAGQGFEVSGLTGPAFQESMDAQFDRWAKIVKSHRLHGGGLSRSRRTASRKMRQAASALWITGTTPLAAAAAAGGPILRRPANQPGPWVCVFRPNSSMNCASGCRYRRSWVDA
jgi:tripartite-type tricarboxylate transporter receptor subunit TctC